MKKEFGFNPIENNNKNAKYAFEFLILKIRALFDRFKNILK